LMGINRISSAISTIILLYTDEKPDLVKVQ
jgi:hypothetical protein